MPSLALQIAADHPSFAGHFPGQPVLPGVVLLAEVLEALAGDAQARAVLGDAPRLGTAKFQAPVGPGASLRIDWQVTDERIRFDVHELREDGARLAANGHFDAGGASR